VQPLGISNQPLKSGSNSSCGYFRFTPKYFRGKRVKGIIELLLGVNLLLLVTEDHMQNCITLGQQKKREKNKLF
jgi:hypothetical protein